MNSKNVITSYSDIIKYRTVWMGMAIVWVILFHSGLKMPTLQFVKASGYGGVDIFIFASGIGCFTSLFRNPDYFGFMHRRMEKILPTYYVFLFGWLLYEGVSSRITFQQILGNIFV